MIPSNSYLHESAKIVQALAPVTPSTSTPDYVSLKSYGRATVIISVSNATTVTGSAITLHQATDVSATGEKTLAFTKAWRNLDTSASDALEEFAVTSNTFTTDATNSTNSLYVIELEAAELDVNGEFDCFRVGTADAANTTLNVEYVLWVTRYKQAVPPSAIVD